MFPSLTVRCQKHFQDLLGDILVMQNYQYRPHLTTHEALFSNNTQPSSFTNLWLPMSCSRTPTKCSACTQGLAWLSCGDKRPTSPQPVHPSHYRQLPPLVRLIPTKKTKCRCIYLLNSAKLIWSKFLGTPPRGQKPPVERPPGPLGCTSHWAVEHWGDLEGEVSL